MKTKIPKQEWLTTGDVCNLTGASRREVLSWITDGSPAVRGGPPVVKLKALRTSKGGWMRTTRAWLAEFLAHFNEMPLVVPASDSPASAAGPPPG